MIDLTFMTPTHLMEAACACALAAFFIGGDGIRKLRNVARLNVIDLLLIRKFGVSSSSRKASVSLRHAHRKL